MTMFIRGDLSPTEFVDALWQAKLQQERAEYMCARMRQMIGEDAWWGVWREMRERDATYLDAHAEEQRVRARKVAEKAYGGFQPTVVDEMEFRRQPAKR